MPMQVLWHFFNIFPLEISTRWLQKKRLRYNLALADFLQFVVKKNFILLQLPTFQTSRSRFLGTLNQIRNVPYSWSGRIGFSALHPNGSVVLSAWQIFFSEWLGNPLGDIFHPCCRGACPQGRESRKVVGCPYEGEFSVSLSWLQCWLVLFVTSFADQGWEWKMVDKRALVAAEIFTGHQISIDA